MKLVILDRDGVINQDSDDYIKSAAEWIPIPGSLEAIAQLHQQGYTVAVATNQSGLARGLFDQTALDAIHKKMHQAVEQAGGKIDLLVYCPHGPSHGCDCRKPQPGLFQQIADHYQTSLEDVSAIGDSLRDLQAASALGCQPMLVKTGKGERTLANNNLHDTPVYDDLASAVQHILQQ